MRARLLLVLLPELLALLTLVQLAHVGLAVLLGALLGLAELLATLGLALLAVLLGLVLAQLLTLLVAALLELLGLALELLALALHPLALLAHRLLGLLGLLADLLALLGLALAALDARLPGDVVAAVAIAQAGHGLVLCVGLLDLLGVLLGVLAHAGGLLVVQELARVRVAREVDVALLAHRLLALLSLLSALVPLLVLVGLLEHGFCLQWKRGRPACRGFPRHLQGLFPPADSPENHRTAALQRPPTQTATTHAR